MNNVFRIQIYFLDPKALDVLKRELEQFFPNILYPKRSFLVVRSLPNGAKIAIEALARK
jgi:hypothetical protein